MSHLILWKVTNMSKVWIALDDLNGRPCHADAINLLVRLDIQTDAWGRGPAEISEEALAALKKFELEHSDGDEYDPSEGGYKFVCKIVHPMTDGEFKKCHEVQINMPGANGYTFAWQL